MKLPARLGDEAGQSVVLFVLVMTGLFTITAFVVNVGALLQKGHRLQGTAESASLIAAQEDVSTDSGPVGSVSRRSFFAGYDAVYSNGYLSAHGPAGVGPAQVGTCSGFCSDVRDGSGSDKPATEVDLSLTANTYFGGIFDMLGFDLLDSVNLHASAVASTQPPTTVDQIAPLAIECDVDCQNHSRKASGVWHWPLDGSTYCFRFQPNDTSAGQNPTPGCDPHGGGAAVPHFGPIDIPGSSLNNLGCAPESGPGNCNTTEVDIATNPDQPRDASLPKFDFRTEVENAEGPSVRLVPVYDSFTPDPSTPSYHLIGWAAVSWTVRSPAEPFFEIDVSFHRLFVDSTRLTGPGVPAADYDFGVEAVGLTGCKSISNGCGG